MLSSYRQILENRVMKFDYRTQYYFPPHIVTAGHVLIFVGMVVMVWVQWMTGLCALLIGLFLVSLNYGIQIDTEKKQYLDYLFILGYKKGTWRRYKKVEYFYITSGMVTTTMQLRAASSELAHMEYNGYIKFSEEDKVHLVSSKRKRKVIIFVEKMARDLGAKIKDLSS